MKPVILLLATVMLASSSCTNPPVTSLPEIPVKVEESSPPVPAAEAKIVIPPKYTVVEVLAIAKKLSPECMAKKGEPIGK